MLDIMSQAKDAIETYNTRLRAISANITNMALTGYKRSEVSFQDVFNKLIKPGTEASGMDDLGGTNPVQMGGTAAIANSQVDFSQGDLIGGDNLDLAVTGQGLFVVSPDGGKSFLYTRDGEFTVSSDKKLLTKSGMQVYGFKRTGGKPQGQLVPINLTGLSFDPTQITFDANGVLQSGFNSSTGQYSGELPYQIGLVSFTNPGGLEYKDGTAFGETETSGAPGVASVPDANTVGTVTPRNKEQSNVTYTSEIVDSLEIQRALSGALTVVKLLNDSIQEFVNKIGS